MSTTDEKRGSEFLRSAGNSAEPEKLYQVLKNQKAKLIGPAGEVTTLPDSLRDFLLELLRHLQGRRSVSIVQSQARLTTVEAAEILGTSRQFLVGLLENGEIPYHKVGSHRRIYSRDLLQYKAKRNSSRREILRDLVRHEDEEGLYNTVPLDADE